MTLQQFPEPGNASQCPAAFLQCGCKAAVAAAVAVAAAAVLHAEGGGKICSFRLKLGAHPDDDDDDDDDPERGQKPFGGLLDRRIKGVTASRSLSHMPQINQISLIKAAGD